MHGIPHIHNPPSHKHMCLQDLSTMMTGHGLTLPPSFVESQPCLLPSLVRCPSAFLEGVCDDSQTQLHQYNRQCLTAPETGWVSFLAYLRPVRMLFPPHGFMSLSDESFSLAKVGQTVATPRTVPIQGQIFRQPSADCTNLGIPENFSLNFLA